MNEQQATNAGTVSRGDVLNLGDRKRDPVIMEALTDLARDGLSGLRRRDPHVRMDPRHVVTALRYLVRLEETLDEFQRKRTEETAEAEGEFAEFRIRTRRLQAGGRMLHDSAETLVGILRQRPTWRAWQIPAWRRAMTSAMIEWSSITRSYAELAEQTLAWIRGEEPLG